MGTVSREQKGTRCLPPLAGSAAGKLPALQRPRRKPRVSLHLLASGIVSSLAFSLSFPTAIHGSLSSQALSYTCHSYPHPQALIQPVLLSNLFSLRNRTWASSPTGRPHAQASLTPNCSLDQGVIWLKRGKQRLESGIEK